MSISFLAALIAPALAASPGDWPGYGYDAGGSRYSPLTDITPANVSQLQPAWTYHMAPADAGPPPAPANGAPAPRRRQFGSESTPLAVNGVLYMAIPYGRIVALDADSGQQIWSYVLPNNDQPAVRGVAYWPGSGQTPAEIVFGTRDGKLIAIVAKTGQPAAGFGVDGIVDMKTPDVMNGLPNAPYALSSPPSIYMNFIITGSKVQEAPVLGAAGDVRAWDARTGKLVWTFRSIPPPGAKGHETWEGDSWKRRSGVNIWGLLTVDDKRGIVYMPFGAPTIDRYGGDHKGANLFSDAIVAADAATGKYLWHYQIVHHDIWDYDLNTPPTLVDVHRNGKTIPAVAVMNKDALLYILDRVTGKPLYDVTETPVPPSNVMGEEAWPTQPIPAKPAQLARNSFSPDEVATLTPELKAFCENLIATQKLHSSVAFSPLTADAPIIRFPGPNGGPEWGGGAFDPALGYFIINTTNLGSVEKLVQHADGSWGNTGSNFMDPSSRLMCQQPPWGSLYAVDVNTGEIAWRENLGVSDNLPEGLRNTGRPNVGGPIVTATGLVFIGATDDNRFRAFDAKSGAELWTYKLDYSAHATPITYRGKSGRQYVAVVATGGSFLGSSSGGDSLVAFALPGTP